MPTKKFDLRPDPYDAWTRTHRTNIVLASVCGLFFLMLCGCAYLIWCLYSRPMTASIADCSGAAPRVVVAGHQDALTKDYVRAFFVRMLKLRFGWSSETVIRDMDSYLRLCGGDLRTVEEKILFEKIPNPDNRGEGMTRIEMFRDARVRHDIILPISVDQIDCRDEPEDRMWHCVTTFTRRMLSTQLPSAAPSDDTIRIMMSFGVVPRTPSSLDGLIVLGMQELNSEDFPKHPTRGS